MTKRDELRTWILHPHDQKVMPPAQVPGPGADTMAIGHVGVWFAVINVEGDEDDQPESMWRDEDSAKKRADELNEGRYHSWQASPAVGAVWMRNEMPDP